MALPQDPSRPSSQQGWKDGLIPADLETRPAADVVEARADYLLGFAPADKELKLKFAGQIVARSKKALVLTETRLNPVTYFPREDVDFSLLEESAHHTHCPFKGNARYWNLVSGTSRVENAAWAYDDPLPEAKPIKGHIAFYADRMEALCTVGDTLTVAVEGKAREDNPFVDWLLKEAWEATTSHELVARFCQRAQEAGIPLSRFNLLIRTLHPQVASWAYVWRQGVEKVEMRSLTHAQAMSERFNASPLIPIFEGAGGIRRRLEDDQVALDFPILKDLKRQGATDYVAMPLYFSDGQINVITLTSDRAGGFTTDHLGKVYEVLPLLSRLFEVQAIRRMSKSLLDTYLGKHSGDRVMKGLVKRGDGETIPAVVWMCDLRESTRLTEELGQEAYLRLLNGFFEAAVDAVIAARGEVLKFIGDAVLAIFPAENQDALKLAAHLALTASNDFKARMGAVNLSRRVTGGERIGYGLAVHLGDLTYGNVGGEGRLDFTVIGPAANETARINELCKSLEEPILFSQGVACYLGDDLRPVGRHTLRGAKKSVALFAPT